MAAQVQDRPAARRGLCYSFEFFPPRTPDATGALHEAAARLARLAPDFFSVTYGAGGSTRTLTLETVQEVVRRTGMEGAPHLSCIASTQEQLRQVLEDYRARGLRRLVALRGDAPSGGAGNSPLRYADQLVAFIRRTTGAHFFIEVAAYPEVHPQARSARADLEHFRRKVEAGADGAITQFFYNPDCYYRFRERCESAGLDLPIVPGILPITNWRQLHRFAERCGAELPRWLLYRLRDFQDDLESLSDFGADVVTRLCAQLLEQDSPGLHFYTLNRAPATERIWRALKLRPEGGEGLRAHGSAAASS